ncbi:hypothetical protein JB92DRAFT_1665857 [Gautieria morchelliformis]|nr:hypothetical protein JB92DRAFT_1665857 [Gautieria morchelliformis]
METGTIEKSDKATSRETVSGSTLSIIPGEDRGVEHSLDLSAVSAGPERATLSEPRSRAGVEVDMGQGSTQQIAFLCNPNMLSSTEVAAPNLHMTNRTGSRQTCSTESGSETRHQTALLVNQAPHLDGTQRIEQKTITGCSTQWTLQSSTVEERSDLISKVVIPGSSLISSSMMQGAQPTTKQAVPVSLRTEADKTFSTLTASKGKESSEAMAKRVLQAEDEVYDANVNAHIGMAEDMKRNRVETAV